ncbi:MAG: cache domain-containing protein [Candidatus Omnitrophica bacterium]|nr:cache domain-containing protein [Candidatus Omnitrophota bacterium]
MKRRTFFIMAAALLCVFCAVAAVAVSSLEYQHERTKELVGLVDDAAGLVKDKGEAAFPEFRISGSKWLTGDTYIFVLDPEGNMLVHPDEALEGKNEMNLKDANGKPIVSMLIETASGKDGEGWVHYLWPKPRQIEPSWKSAFAKAVTAPSGKIYIVGSGCYDLKMEKKFISDVVDEASKLIEKKGAKAFADIRDKAGAFTFLDTYVFVDTPDGVEVVNAAFPSIEGKNMMNFRDVGGKYVVMDYINAALTKGSAWVDYLWPKPGETNPSIKYTYVRKVNHGNEVFIVGSGAYLD